MLIGRHAISDIYGCDPDHLRDEHYLNSSFTEVLGIIGATVLKRVSYKFPDQGGVTGIFLLSESHATYHTYPEYGYVAVDFFTCGACDPDSAILLIKRKLEGFSGSRHSIERGFPSHLFEVSPRDARFGAAFDERHEEIRA